MQEVITGLQTFPGNLTADNDPEIPVFKKLQEGFSKQFEHVFPDKLAPRTVIIVPSLSMDTEILAKISGIVHYEERLLCLLMLLRMPRTHIVYVTSSPIDPVIIDYYLHMLPGITGYHALGRLTLLSCHDSFSKIYFECIMLPPTFFAHRNKIHCKPAQYAQLFKRSCNGHTHFS